MKGQTELTKQEQLIRSLPSFLRVLHHKQYPNRNPFEQPQQNWEEKQNSYKQNGDSAKYNRNAISFRQVQSQNKNQKAKYQIYNVNQIATLKKICYQILDKIKISLNQLYHPGQNNIFIQELVSYYLQTLCKMQDNKANLTFFINKFQLELSFDLIKQPLSRFNNNLIQALIYQKYSQFDLAYQSYLHLLKYTLFQIKLQQKSQSSNALWSQNLKKYFQKIINVCQKQYLKQKKHVNFIRFLNNAQAFTEFCFNDQKLIEFSDCMLVLLSNLIQRLCFNIQTSLLMQQIFKQNKFQFKPQIECYLLFQLIKKQKFNIFLHKSASKCFNLNQKNKRILSFRKFKKGTNVKRNCHFCAMPFDFQVKTIIYGCGHSFHSYCNSDKKECVQCLLISAQFTIQKVINKISTLPETEQNTELKKKSASQNNAIRNNTNYLNSKQQKIYYQKRKLKIYDYQQYQKQKITLNLLKTQHNDSFCYKNY